MTEQEKALAKYVGSLVRQARIAAGLTQKELAKLVGTQQHGISRLENGDNLPSLTLLFKVAAALGMKIDIAFIPK